MRVICTLIIVLFNLPSSTAHAIENNDFTALDLINSYDEVQTGAPQATSKYITNININTISPKEQDLKIYGSTSVSPGTVRTNPSGTPSYTEDWDYLINALNTPDKISNYIINNFKYNAHGSDTPYLPRDLNEMKLGDCKDFTAFSGLMLSLHSYNGNQISFGYGKNLGHAATLYNQNGSDWVMSNGGVYGPIQNPTDLGIVARQIIEAPSNYNIGPIQYYPLNYQGAFSIGNWSP